MTGLKGPKGFTLVEIMIVVAIIGILGILAIPNFLKAGQSLRAGICIKNMRVIDDAISQWMFEGSHSGEVDVNAIVEYIKGGELPVCPLGDEPYIIHDIGDSPRVECPNYNEDTHAVTIE